MSQNVYLPKSSTITGYDDKNDRHNRLCRDTLGSEKMECGTSTQPVQKQETRTASLIVSHNGRIHGYCCCYCNVAIFASHWYFVTHSALLV
jgi:hypothetical protein